MYKLSCYFWSILFTRVWAQQHQKKNVLNSISILTELTYWLDLCIGGMDEDFDWTVENFAKEVVGETSWSFRDDRALV